MSRTDMRIFLTSVKELLAQIETEYGNYDEAIRLYREQIDSRPDSYWSDGKNYWMNSQTDRHGFQRTGATTNI